MALSIGFRFKEIFKDVKNYLFGRSWGPSMKPKAKEWTRWPLMTPFKVHYCPRAPWSYLVTSCGIPACVLKHWPRNLGGLVCPRLLT